MLNVPAVLLAETAGLAWFVAVLGIALIARRTKPFGSAAAVRDAWMLVGVAEVVGTALGAVAVWVSSWAIPPSLSPLPLLILQMAGVVVFQTALFSWASTFPVVRVALRRVTTPTVVEREASKVTSTAVAPLPSSVSFISARWPQHIWSVGALHVQTSLDSSQAIAVLSQRLKDEFGYRHDLRDPFDADADGAGITYLRPLPWKPRWPSGVFAATVQRSSEATVISGTLRLPWWPLAWCCLCVLGGALVSIDGLNPASVIFPIFGAIVYSVGRFVSLPAAQGSLVAWFSGRSTLPRATQPWSRRRKNFVLATTLGLEVLITGAVFSWHSASVIANPAYLNNPLTAVFEVTFGIVFATTLIANLAIWRRWRLGRRLGLIASAMMAMTCIGIVLALPEFIATLAATAPSSSGAAPRADSQQA